MSEIDDDTARYHAEMHAMQSGVAMEMNYDTGPTQPKHLRVGVNSALVNSSALAALLIAKGVITEAEYTKTMADGMQHEREVYERRIQKYVGEGGPTIHLR